MLLHEWAGRLQHVGERDDELEGGHRAVPANPDEPVGHRPEQHMATTVLCWRMFVCVKIGGKASPKAQQGRVPWPEDPEGMVIHPRPAPARG